MIDSLIERLIVLASWRTVDYVLSVGWVVFRVGHRFNNYNNVLR